MARSKEEIKKVTEAFRLGVSAKDMGKMFMMKRENVYSLLRSNMSKEEYISLTVKRRSVYDGRIMDKRNEIVNLIKSGKLISDVAKVYGMSEFAVRYYYYKYIKPSERKKYLLKSDAKNSQRRLVKIAKIKGFVEKLKDTCSVERLADIEGKKYNTMWVYLRRNRAIIEGLTGMEYSQFLTSVRGYSHDIDVESVLEGVLAEREAHEAKQA